MQTTAADIMTKDVVTVRPETDVLEAARLLLHHRFNGLPVVDATGRLVGIICQADLVAQQKQLPLPSFFMFLDGLVPLTSQKRLEQELEKITAATVAKAMTADPISVTPGTAIEEIASIMVQRNIHTLPVVDGGALVGVIGKEDVLRRLIS